MTCFSVPLTRRPKANPMSLETNEARLDTLMRPNWACAERGMSAIRVPIMDGFGNRIQRTMLRRGSSHTVLQGDWKASPVPSPDRLTESAGEKTPWDRSLRVQKTMRFRQAKRG